VTTADWLEPRAARRQVESLVAMADRSTVTCALEKV
jgi:hypothetical protein